MNSLVSRVPMRLSSHRRGFNLIEAAVVLGVIGLVIAGIWVAAAAVQEKIRISSAAKTFASLVMNMSNLYGRADIAATATGTAEVDVTSVLLKAGVIPGDWVKGNNIRDP